MPIRRWEGTPVQRLGEAIFISVIRTMKTQRQVTTEHFYLETILQSMGVGNAE